MLSRKTILFFAFFLFVTACSSDDDKSGTGVDENNIQITDDAGTDDIGTTSDAEADIDEEPQYTCPNEGEQVCGGFCVNTSISMDHCGSCDNACTVGRMTCDGTDCVCLSGKTMCDGACFDTTVTREHCGMCGNACTIGQACVDSACIEISDRPEVLGVLQETNTGRQFQQDCGEHGLKNPVGGLQLNDELMAAAQAHSEDMAANNFMEHEGSDGSSPGDRAARANYSSGFVGENIARGYRSPEAVVAAWIDSDGHCNNLMNGQYNEIGIGYAENENTGEPFWTQLFGRR